MSREYKVSTSLGIRVFLLLVVMAIPLISGCKEVDTIKSELMKKLRRVIRPKKPPFVPKDGMTIRPCSLYQTANPNSEVLRRLPAEAPVHLIDKVGTWYRVRDRDGREGYLEQKMVAGQQIIQKTQELRKSIEGVPPQAEGVTKNRANFRLDPGRNHEIIEVLPPGKKFEVYERVVTIRPHAQNHRGAGSPQGPESEGQYGISVSPGSADVKKDVWYKVKMEDGRVGYVYTYNIKLTPPEDIAHIVNFMRMVAWQTVNVTDDPDRGAKNNYVVAYAPIGKDAGCDYTRLYLISWSSRNKRRVIRWQLRLSGILPITRYHSEGKPGFTVRYLHPTKSDKLTLANFVLSRGRVIKVSEEEIPNPSQIH